MPGRRRIWWLPTKPGPLSQSLRQISTIDEDAQSLGLTLRPELIGDLGGRLFTVSAELPIAQFLALCEVAAGSRILRCGQLAAHTDPILAILLFVDGRCPIGIIPQFVPLCSLGKITIKSLFHGLSLLSMGGSDAVVLSVVTPSSYALLRLTLS